jgi:2-haloacid dehalogenase
VVHLDDTVEILAELKNNQVPLFILSNWSVENYSKAEAIYDFLHWFDGKIISEEIGKIN